MRLLNVGLIGAVTAFSTVTAKKADPPIAAAIDREILSPKLSLGNLEAGSIEGPENFEFRAETERLMDIIINSLYAEKEVALRELISNAADAIEKVRISALKDKRVTAVPGMKEPYLDYKIQVQLDKKNGVLSIIDTGIGMTRKELETNLGTVAKSGTDQFMEAAKRGTSASNLIGQFGVGFYSAFLIADEVTVISKSPFDSQQHIWRSTRNGKFTIGKDKRLDVDESAKIKRGTIVSLKLKEEVKKPFTDGFDVNKILKRFSSFIQYPIYLGVVKEEEDDVKWRLVNENKPLWLRDKSEITEEEYDAFYKSISKDYEGSAAHTHFRAEGDIDFTGLFYIPKRGREDIVHLEKDEGSHVKLYVQRVLISDNLEDFFPSWMSFVRGVVDSNDLPLKVDRETFAQKKIMHTIRSKSVSKIFEMLKTLSREADRQNEEFEKQAASIQISLIAGDKEAEKTLTKLHEEFAQNNTEWGKFNQVWTHFANNFMLGCLEPGTSSGDRKKILDLFRGYSSKTGLPITLKTYIDRMKPQQKKIFYVTGDDIRNMMRLPYMEFFLANDIEVLMLTGPFDEGCIGTAQSYKDYKFATVEKNVFEPGEFAFVKAGKDEAKLEAQRKLDIREKKAVDKYYEPLTNWISDYLGLVRAQYVIPAVTLVDSPAMISSPQHGMTAAHERMARTSLGGNKLMMESFAKMKNFEYNPRHPLLHKMLEEIKNLKNAEPTQEVKARSSTLNSTIDLLYEAAMIHSGFPPRQPHLVINHLYKGITEKIIEGTDNKSFKLAIPKAIYDEVDLAEAARERDEIDRDAENLGAKFSFSGEDEDEDDEDFFPGRDEL